MCAFARNNEDGYSEKRMCLTMPGCSPERKRTLFYSVAEYITHQKATYNILLLIEHGTM